MPNILKDGAIIADSWVFLDPPENNNINAQYNSISIPDNTPAVVVSLDSWLSQRTELISAEKSIGIWLEGHCDLDSVEKDLALFKLIAIHFSSFTDGRGFSLGNLLRDRFGFQGELRAMGNLLPDQLYYLHRCGFNAFAFTHTKDLELAQSALTDFSNNYQQTWGYDKPIFKRR